MSTQVNFVCWSPEVVTATIPTEAATPSDAVLLATHTPLRITRRGGKGGRDATETVNERQVLDEFLNSEPNNGVLVATILGESGAGKSHLVRWTHANIAAQAKRHVIYLQKTETSLKDVIERLLLDQTDPEFDDIRRRVGSLGSGVTVEEMEQKILAELAEALRTHESQTPLGKPLVGENGLSLFFLDPLFRRHLLRPGSFIKRRAHHALHGRDPDEPDVPLEFTVDELPLDIVDFANLKDAAAATQKLFTRLSSNAAMQAEAVRMLNELLDVAVTKAASLGIGDVSQAFMRIREKLVGQEIVLLIEDVALIQGVRRDLLDAIVEVGVVKGQERYATVRTMMAVTAGYYYESLPDTFRRRAEPTSPLYEVDVDLAGADTEELVDFVGRYLNAARVGKDAIESASPNVPNACGACIHSTSCHESFGVSSAGYGLYPYNRPALIRAVNACAEKAPDGQGRANFNPRKVLSRAVRDVLNDNAAVIEDGAFPLSSFLAEESTAMSLPRLPLHVQEKIQADYSEGEAGRLDVLLNFWGDRGRKKIDAGILSAFSHEPIPETIFDTDGADRDRDRDRDGDQEGERDGLGDVPRSVKRKIEAIDDWANDKKMPPALASEIRAIVREALIARLDWFELVIKDPDVPTVTKAIPAGTRSVSIEGSDEHLNVVPLVTVKRTARMAMMLRGLVYIGAGLPQLAGEALPRLDALVDGSVVEARDRIVQVLAVDDASLIEAAASLLRGAAACGQFPAKSNDLDLINAVLWRNDGKGRLDASVRSPEWMDAFEKYVVARDAAVDRLLAGVGAAQGSSGAVHALDAHRLTEIVRRAKEVVAADAMQVVPPWCEDADKKLKALVRASQTQLDHWTALVDRARAYLPQGVSYLETVDAILDATKIGQPYGLVKVANLAALADVNTAARTWDPAGLVQLEKLLDSAKSKTGFALLGVVGTEVQGDLVAIADYLESSSQWIDAGLRDAAADAGEVADLDADIDRAIERWFEILTEDDPEPGAEGEDGTDE
jgi:hypothetical protein